MANSSASLDSVFHALADPTRRAIVQRLGRGAASVGELAKPFDMALPSFMKHIAVLERSRLIVSWKQGRVRTCSLERRNLAAAERWFESQRTLWAKRHDNLDLLLIELNGDKNDG
jgi:DNA-binding transcriptional ArsR family regulator